MARLLFPCNNYSLCECTVLPDAIKDIRVLETIKEGKTIYRAQQVSATWLYPVEGRRCLVPWQAGDPRLNEGRREESNAVKSVGG